MGKHLDDIPLWIGVAYSVWLVAAKPAFLYCRHRKRKSDDF
jgi:hypothetical protein